MTPVRRWSDRGRDPTKAAVLSVELRSPRMSHPDRSSTGRCERVRDLGVRTQHSPHSRAASVAPLLYLIFVGHYATNAMFGDDWSVVPLVHAAVHGDLTLSLLWGQYNESSLFLGNLVDVLFGVTDHLDLRAVIFFSAALLIASYAILLALFRQYLRKRLTPLPVFVIGLVWFSLADVQNALWAFQVSWYLTTFFFIAMLFALLVPDRHSTTLARDRRRCCNRRISLNAPGALLWPLGAICLLWSEPRSRRAIAETAAWCGAMIVILALYLPGYDFGNNGCVRVCRLHAKLLPASSSDSTPILSLPSLAM